MNEANESIAAGYELSPTRLRAWLGDVEVRLENQWAGLLQPAPRGAIGIDLLQLGCHYDDRGGRLDARAAIFGAHLAVSYRTGSGPSRERVRRAAADAAAVAGRLARGSS